MDKKVGTIIETVSEIQAELRSIIGSFPEKTDHGTTRRILLYWRKWSREKLLSVLVDDEMKSFDHATKAVDAWDINFANFETRFKDYSLSLNYALAKSPEIVIKPSLVKQAPTPITNVFLSYTWADDGPVLAIDQWLRNKGIQTRIDKRDFFVGFSLRGEIVRVMTNCTVIIFFHSIKSKDKPWIELERELANALEMDSKQNGKEPPRILYVVMDNTPLPTAIEKQRIAIMAKGKLFGVVCDEIYRSILRLPGTTPDVDLSNWDRYQF